MRNVVKLLRRKLGDDADNATYMITEPRAGYRMAVGRERRSLEVESLVRECWHYPLA